MEGWRKEDPPTKNKLPVGIDVPDILAELGMSEDATEVVKAVGDCNIILIYQLLRVGDYKLKDRGMRQSKRCSSSWKMQYFLSGF